MHIYTKWRHYVRFVILSLTIPIFLLSQIILASSDVLTEKFRYDECSSDLEDRLKNILQYSPKNVLQNATEECSGRYFLSPKSSQAIEHSNFVPLPIKILEQYGNVECASFMGLIPEINRYMLQTEIY